MKFQYPITISIGIGRKVAEDKYTRIPDTEDFKFLIRTITRREFQIWKSRYEDQPDELEEILIQEAVTETPSTFKGQDWEWDIVYAGIPSQLAIKILNLSGFGSSEPDAGMTQRTEEYVTSDESKYDLIILMAFDLHLEELLDMETEVWHRTLALAYMKLQLLGIDPEAILDPEKAKRKMPTGSMAPPQVQGHPQGGQHTWMEQSGFSFES